MAEEGGFLARWSKRKREAARQDVPTVDPEARGAPAPDGAVAVPAASEPAEGSEDETFDISTLPPVESLTAESDIRDFLRKGVPEPLKNAALRKVWAADPFLRNFGGPGEYAWDFNDPDSIPGFSSAPPDFDLLEHARAVTGHAAPAPSAKEGAGTGDTIAEDPGPDVSSIATGHVGSGMESEPPVVHSTSNAALQPDAGKGDATDDREISEPLQAITRGRRHGGAVPI
jgi:hypothetical protein